MNHHGTKKLKINQLRRAIRSNRISFPAQVPAFPKHDRADLQPKLVLLYFLFGWSCSRIGDRYGLTRQRVQQILTTWASRAIQMGYVQAIPPAKSLRALSKALSPSPQVSLQRLQPALTF
jgi:hypothetical protein